MIEAEIERYREAVITYHKTAAEHTGPAEDTQPHPETLSAFYDVAIVVGNSPTLVEIYTGALSYHNKRVRASKHLQVKELEASIAHGMHTAGLVSEPEYLAQVTASEDPEYSVRQAKQFLTIFEAALPVALSHRVAKQLSPTRREHHPEKYITADESTMHRLYDLARTISRWHLPSKPEEAEEAVQRTMERYWRYRHSYKGDSPLEGWFQRIAVNEVRRVGARVHRRKEHEFSEDATDPESHIASRRSSYEMEDLAGVVDTQAILKEFLGMLTPKETALAIQFFVNDLSHKEVAQILGISEAAARVRLFRLRQRLGGAFEELRAKNELRDVS